ncbi:universal stress protein [Accumulibacter sp.]|jgi:nucleotide-binding universal stress UspA family protein|uniref:UspA domain protein n=1 Tax=Accumulibacter regalis TaxID=522306 RepID=C7RLK7_ACCRE|nr:universal stress protein [Accumulibacter sp.]MBN8498076.1 universal stress protein [Accumulibacter sp.]MBO3713896.1 universal stress protein [Accumulibacter sp.]
MLKALIPFDGSDNALRAVDHLISLVQAREPMEVHLLHVREPIDSWEIRRVLTADEIAALQLSEGEDALQAARQRLDAAGISYTATILVGDVAQTIARHATEIGCDKIIMGSSGASAIAGLLLGSVTMKVIHLAQVPVTVVK